MKLKPGKKIMYLGRIGFISYKCKKRFKWSIRRYNVIIGPNYQLYTKIKGSSLHPV